MAVNKNFVVKHGLEVNSDLILADSTNKRVGIGTTIPDYTLEVIGGIGVTDINATGIATVKKTLQVGSSGTVISAFESGLVGIGTTNPAYLLDVRTSTGATTGTTVLYVQGDAPVTGNLDVAGDIQYDEVTGRNLYISGLSTFVGVSTFESAVGFRTDVFISGMSTVVGVATFRDNVFIDGTTTILGNLNVTGDISYDEVTGRNIYISGLSTFVGVSTFSTGLFTKDLYVTGVSTFDGAIDANAAINVADSTALTFGADDDLEIYHTAGSNSYIKNNATDLEVRSDSSKFLSKNGSDLFAALNSSGVGVGTTNVGAAADSNNTKVVNAGIVTANYLYGDISGTTGVTTGITAAIGVSSEGTFVGGGSTIINFASSTGTSWNITASGGIATATVTPGVSLGLAIALGG